ncbi:xanthine dehydrogenase accessory factor [Tissierella praeacuta DSM 18095]|uniref:Xanthine dehydrogenase accessory factor n=1 Tax=Tissierella praeacuta DSM 18095 TaxID=1123404 RepID=A0A1M4UJ33_9FIRM|nr:XdhC/CoxI family protein [Tissierella praeacuta]SHE56675.1 xanthine dehydrogenase accessory factor [Tissierella praeacuta DSM 18095]SUP03671.1 xanthine dehydrogenase accessory protein XdhC [Tissierella praeacuta]
MGDFLVMKKALEEIDNGKELAIATIIKSEGSTPRGLGTMMAVLEDGSIYGTIGGGALEKYIIELCIGAIKEGESKTIDLPLDAEGVDMVCGGKVEVFIDVYKIKPKLLIIGGGHVGYAIYNIASLLNFNISIFEDREEFLTKERFPLAKELILGSIDERLRNYKIDNNTYIVIVSRGHKSDERALLEVINSNAKYIGVMGSKGKVMTMMDKIRNSGITEENINKIYAPIGLKISSGSPEEIAMSIMAEILLIKNNGTLKHMKQ